MIKIILTLVRMLLGLSILLIFPSCGHKSTYGVNKLPEFQKFEFEEIVIDKNIKPDKKFVDAIKLHTERILKKKKEQSIKINHDKAIKKIKAKSKIKVISNLKTLGVINITERLKGPQAKLNTTVTKKLDKKQIFIKKIDGNKDRFGGKIICNTEVLTHRIDRTNFIQCLKNQDKLEKLSLFNFFVNRNLTSLADVKSEDVKQECKVTYAVSLHSYHELTECLIHDFEKGGFFKFRNSNSLGAKFDIL